MNKPFIVFLLMLVFSFRLSAQTSTTIVQTVDLHLVNVIKIKFANTNSQQGNLVSIPLNNINDMINGVKSDNQNLVVSSTKNFNVNIKSVSQGFTYTGTNQANNDMQVSDVLTLRVNQNNTGGSIGNGYNAFMPITSNTQNIINGGTRGQEKAFRVRYKATPGMDYAAGNYLTSVVYTATQQ